MCSSFVTPWHQIKALIKKYIQRQETINLVVVPCNVDIATTEALSMAQEVVQEKGLAFKLILNLSQKVPRGPWVRSYNC